MYIANPTDLDAAIGVFRDSPRTCQYFYVVADGNTNWAVGMEASWNEFRTVQPGEADPLWLDHALDLIRGYDRQHGTVLATALARTRIVVLHQRRAWAAFVPRLRTTTLDPVLQTEAPEAVATVLAHEAQHAADMYLNGFLPTEAAC